MKAGKAANKAQLQREMGLPEDPDKMLIGIVSRLTDQKGFDLIAYKLEDLCNGGAQIVVLGTGEEQYENLFRHYSWKYPDRFAARITYSNELSHKIYAGCDAFLMPSAFEPCGLSQLISMHYGTVPIVRETGGLRDTVIPYNKYTGDGTGFTFANYNADDMIQCVWRSMDVYYNDKKAWENLAKHGMEADYSWGVSAEKYIDMYCDLTGLERPTSGSIKKNSKPERHLEHLPDFAERIQNDFMNSEGTIERLAAEPGVIKVKNPFGDDEVSEKSGKKTSEKAEKKPAKKRTTSKATKPKASVGGAVERLDNAAAQTPVKKTTRRRKKSI